MKRLSVCMIVKDEEVLLARCLDSIKSIADEIVIVDTGSTDRTKKVAQEYTHLIFDYKWSNDFAAARNESIRHATGKWILVMDADEYLSLDDYNEWNHFLDREIPVENLAYTLPIINFTGEKEFQDEITTSPVTRLFPNYKGIFFERPIHEQLTRGSSKELFHKKLELNIYHTGYQEQRVVEKNKHERNMSIFNEMKKHQNMSEYDWFTLGNQYRYAKNEVEATDCYERALKGTSSKVAWYPHCLIGLISLYYKQDRLHLSWKWTEDKLSLFEDYSEYYAIKGIHYETLGFFEQAISCYLKAISIAEERAANQKEFWLVDPMYSFETPVQQLISLYFRLNDNQQAIYWLSILLNKNNKHPRVLLRLIEWLCQNESENTIIEFLNQHFNVEKRSDITLIYKVSLALGQDQMASYYLSFLKDDDSLTNSDHIRIAVMKQDKKSWEEACSAVKKVTEGDKQQLWIQTVLGSLIWSDIRFLNSNYFGEDEDIQSVNVLISQIIKGEQIDDSQMLIEYSGSLFLVAKQLFLIKNYELFDNFVQAVKSAELINMLANYFYGLNLIEMAMNYYSVLLVERQLDATSLENLAFYHLNHGHYDEAKEFLEELVELQPKARHLYYFLIRSAGQHEKRLYIDKFISEFPDFSSISFVRKFIN
ncbi:MULTISPECIES: glycosyltransferase [Paenibacillus]|nr:MULTISPECIES: glycosyltransferase [Paenibacillus]MDY7991547.1 glycosyltransferase [Paenibacillus polymyxa]PNQ82563.1 glycosyltransferase family 2 protein [Paenibacillus sp. F4]